MGPKTSTKSIAAVLAAALVSQFSLPAQAASSRYLKMRAHVGNITAKPVQLPGQNGQPGEVIDFPYVANALFYSQVFAHGYFEESNFLEEVLEEVNTSKSATTGEFSNKPTDLPLSEDASLLLKYGLGNAVKTASSGSTFRLKALADDGTGTGDPIADTPICQYNQPAIKLRGAIIAYELAFGGGITAGYNQSGTSTSGSIGGKANIQSHRLDAQFDAVDPLFSRTNKEAVIASVPVKKNVIDLDLGVTFNIGIPIGINFFMKGSIPASIRKVMTKGLDSIIAELQKQSGKWDSKVDTGSWKTVWESRVIYSKLADFDDYVAVAGGSRAYVKIGDQFHIKNMYWNWAGTPCDSRLMPDTMASAMFGEAIGTVVETGPYVSILRVQPINGHEQGIKPGALVKIEKLAN